MKRMQRILSPVLVTVLALMISACGFQLRGTANIASDLKHLSVEGNERAFQRMLTHRLELTGIDISGAAPYKVEVLSLNHEEKAVSSSGGTIVTDYEITATLTWQLVDEAGLVLIPAEELVQYGTYQRQADEYNASQNAGLMARNELHQNLSMALTRRIAALSDTTLQTMAEETQKRRSAGQAASATSAQ